MSKINIVLFQPEIPQNTANIIRTCVGLDAHLHLIKPYGFDLNLSSKVFKRNSANYLEFVTLTEYETFEEFEAINNSKNFLFSTRYGTKIYDEISIKDMEEVFYIFGRESSGIDEDILKKYKNQTFRIPMHENLRSLNLANCVALIAYDGERQLDFESLKKVEPHNVNYWTKGGK